MHASDAVCDAVAALDGDIMVLGAAGKMGRRCANSSCELERAESLRYPVFERYSALFTAFRRRNHRCGSIKKRCA